MSSVFNHFNAEMNNQWRHYINNLSSLHNRKYNMTLLKEIHGLMNSKVLEDSDGSLQKLKQALTKIQTPTIADFVAKVNKDEDAKAKLKKFESEMMKLYQSTVEANRNTAAAKLWSFTERLTSDRMGMPGYWGSGTGMREHGVKFTLENILAAPMTEIEKAVEGGIYAVEELIRKHKGGEYESPHEATHKAMMAASKK